MPLQMWVLWAFFLFAQNASFTWVSRARNSGSLKYHATAAFFSNGIYFVQMFFVVDVLTQVTATGDGLLAAFAAVFYTTCTVIGSVAMHHFLQTKVETGKRRVGSSSAKVY